MLFTPLPGRNALGVPPDRIIAVIESINTPNVSIPDVGTEPTKAFLIGCVTPSGGACVFCYLLQTLSNRPVCYLSNPSEVGLEAYTALEAESIHYVESMGFMLDNMNFRARAPHEVAALVETLPFFRDQHPGTPSPAAGARATTPPTGGHERGAIGRLLASF